MNNPAKAYLSRYRALEAKCRALERAVREALESATNTTAALKAVAVKSSGGGQRMADAVIRAVDACRVLEDQKAEALRAMAEIMEAIRSVPDEIQQTVLIEKYVNGRTLQQIQADISYSDRQTARIHGYALWAVWQYMKRRGLWDGEDADRGAVLRHGAHGFHAEPDGSGKAGRDVLHGPEEQPGLQRAEHDLQ